MKSRKTLHLRLTTPVTLTTLAALLSTFPALSQRTNGRNRADSTPIYRNSRPPVVSNVPENSDSLIQERLVQLALAGPAYSVTGHQITSAEYTLSRAKRSWLNLLSVAVEYNDQSFVNHANNGPYAYVYPKYFFGLTIPIGLFFTMGPDIHKEKENVAIARDQQEEVARSVRHDVLYKYAEYKAYGQLIAQQTNVVDDEEALRKQVEKKFQDGSISIEDYNAANKVYGDDLTKKLNLQLQQDLLKIDIEQMIGISLESVLKTR